MVVQANILMRNQSDALAKICVRNGERLLRAIRSMGLEADKNLKVKLILYYIEKGDNWDRTIEKHDWKDHNLASLKYHTYKFVVQIIAQSGDSRNSDLYLEVNEIAAAFELGALGHAIELCCSSLAIALEREEYSLAIHLLDLHDEILENLDSSQNIQSAILEVAQIRAETLEKWNEIRLCTEVRRNVIDPIKEEWVENEKAPIHKIGQLREAVDKLNAFRLYSPIARIETCASNILLSLLEGDLASVETHTMQLLKEYDTNPVLKQRYAKRYILHLRSAIQFYLQVSNYPVARRLLNVLASIAKKQPDFEIQAKSAWIYSALRISLYLKDGSLFSKALDMFKELENELLAQVEEKEQMRVYWALVLNHLEWGQLEAARKVGWKLLSRKPSVRKTIVMNARIVLFACEVALFPEDEERLLSSYKATYQFIDRNRDSFPEAFGIIKLFKKLWLSWQQEKMEGMSDEKILKGISPLHDFSTLFETIKTSLKALPRSQ